MDAKRLRRYRRSAKRYHEKRRLELAAQAIRERKSEQAGKIRRNMDVYETLMRHSDVTVPHTLPAKEWIDEFKQRAIDYRASLLQCALNGMAVMEGARQASRNLTVDYGFQSTLDSAEIVNLIKKVSELDILYMLLQRTSLNAAQRNKTLDYAANAMFGPERNKTAVADMLRNLSTPEQSPFGAGNLLRVSDPQFTEKVEQMTGKKRLKDLGPPMIKLRRDIDKIAADVKNDRRNRMLGK
jgi:hypothetical protein